MSDNATTVEFEAKLFFDAHTHLRQGDVFDDLVGLTSAYCSHCLAMPNLAPPLTVAAEVVGYNNLIRQSAHDQDHGWFEPLTALYLSPSWAELSDNGRYQHLLEAYQRGCRAVKLYPAPAGYLNNAHPAEQEWASVLQAAQHHTTGAAQGVPINLIEAPEPWLWDVLSAMNELEMVLCVHAEHPGPLFSDRHREKAFLDLPFLTEALNRFRRLRIVVEHVSSKEGVEFVRQTRRVAATVTLHHLYLTEDDVAGRPHNFCRPPAKSRQDVMAIRNAVLDSESEFFLGSDSAPHPTEAKLKDRAAGCFTSPVLPQKLADFFAAHGALERFENFTSGFGLDFYRLTPSRAANSRRLRFHKQGNLLPYTAVRGGYTVWLGGTWSGWKVETVSA